MMKGSGFRVRGSVGAGIALGVFCLAAGWEVAEPGWQYAFPRDHHAHTDFKTEWWYFTGNLTNASGRRFGYELTFFRQGIRPPSERAGTTSRFIVDDLKFAHFTVTDAAGRKFLVHDQASRGSFGDAGFDKDGLLAWIEEWTLRMNDDGSFDLAADASDAQIALHLLPQKEPVIHGRDGISRKATGAGHASHYYSITRLATSGRVRVRKETFAVAGESWFDHEWATNQLAPGQAGWNWVSAQFDDGSELMLYEMRLTSGEDRSGLERDLGARRWNLHRTDERGFPNDARILLEKSGDKGELPDWLADRCAEGKAGPPTGTGAPRSGAGSGSAHLLGGSV